MLVMEQFKNKKVAMVLSYPFYPDARAYKQLRSLHRNGISASLFFWNRVGIPKKDIPEAEIIPINYPASYGFRKILFKLPIFWFKVYNLVKKGNYSHIQTHNFDTAMIGYLLKRFRKINWVYDSRDYFYPYFMKNGKNTFMSNLVKKIDKFFALRCDTLIVTTNKLTKVKGHREFYELLGIPKNKIITVWNIPEKEAFLNTGKKMHNKKITIGYIGAQRYIDQFIQLFNSVYSEYDKYKILLVGDGRTTDELKRILSRNYNKLEVEFIGSVPYQEIGKYYGMCDVMFSFNGTKEELEHDLNKKGALSTKLVEAASMGIPSLVMANSLNEDFANNYNCGVGVNEISEKEVIPAINKALELKFSSNKIIEEWNWQSREEIYINAFK